MINDQVKVSTSANRRAVTILAIVHRIKPPVVLWKDSGENNPYKKSGDASSK